MKRLILFALFAIFVSLTFEPPLAANPANLQEKQGGVEHQVKELDGSVQLASSSPSYVVLPPGAFASDGSTPADFYIDPDFGYLHGVGAPTNLWAPLYLPTGTAITSLEVFSEDWDVEPNHDLCVYLDRMDLATGDYECCLAEVCTTGSGENYAALIDETLDNPVVSDRYAYQINIYGLYPEIYVYGVRVGYGTYEYLPAVVNETP